MALSSKATKEKYRLVHKDFVAGSKRLADIRKKFDTLNAEKRKLADDLSEKITTLSPLLDTETSLRNELAELTDRFDRQESLRQEKTALAEVIEKLEERVGEKRSGKSSL